MGSGLTWKLHKAATEGWDIQVKGREWRLTGENLWLQEASQVSTYLPHQNPSGVSQAELLLSNVPENLFELSFPSTKPGSEKPLPASNQK